MTLRNPRPVRILLASLACLCAPVAACGDGDEDPGIGIHFATQAEEGCDSLPAETHALPPDVDRVVIVLRGGDGQVAASATVPADRLAEDRAKDRGGRGAIVLEGLVPGEYRMQVAGCRGDVATWWGVAPSVRVEESSKTAPVVFLSPVQGLACVGGSNLNPLAPGFDGDGFLTSGRMAFAAAATGPDGRVVVAGGAPDLLAQDRLSGGRRAWEFHPQTGLFTAIRATDAKSVDDTQVLASGRLGHGLAFLDATTVAVFGGAVSAQVAPTGYAGPAGLPPVLPGAAPGKAVEVLSLDDGNVWGVQVLDVGSWPSVAVRSKEGQSAQAFAMAGGLGTDGKPTGVVALFPQATADKVSQGAPVSGMLATPRFGGAATYLSTGDLLLVGGWDGSAAARPEVLRVAGNAVSSSVLPEAGFPPAGRRATAFPAVAVLQDDGATAKVLVAGGSRFGDPFAYDDTLPAEPQAWILTMVAAGGHFGLDAGATMTPVDAGARAARSLAGVAPFVPIGSAGPGRWLLAGGYQSFTHSSFADCQGNPAVCFPRSATAFDLGTASAVRTLAQYVDVERLGATVAGIGTGSVLVLGGLSGIGTGAGSGVRSSGVIAFAGGPMLDAVCADHPAVAE